MFGDLRRDGSFAQPALRLEDRYFDAFLARRCGDFQSDPATADDDHTAIRSKLLG